MYNEIQRAVALGAKYGFKAIPMYADPTVDTPEIDTTAMEGAVGIVITLAAVIIALYITAIVLGVMSQTVQGTGVANLANGTAAPGSQGGLALPAQWNVTVLQLDTQSTSSFSLAGILPIAIIGVGILVIIISAFAMR